MRPTIHLRGRICKRRGGTARGARMQSPTCRAPRASPAMTIPSSPPKGCRPVLCDGRWAPCLYRPSAAPTTDVAVPVYWRATPTLFSPFFNKPVSSTMSTPLSSSPRCSRTYSLKSSLTSCASHLAGGVQQSLHALRISLAGGLGELPAVLALNPAEQTDEVASGALPRRRAAEAVAHPPMQFSKRLRPFADGRRPRLARPCRSLPRSTGRVAWIRVTDFSADI